MAMNMDAVLRIVAKVVGKEQLTGLQGALVGVENTAVKARKAFTNVTSSAMWQGAAVAATGLGVVLVDSARTAMDFEKAMSGVQAKIGAAGGEMSQLTNLAKDLGRTTQFSASQAAEGMDFLAMAGFKANDVVKAMPGLLDLAAAGNLELGSAADIASNVLGGFGLQAEEAGRVADVLAKAATSSNVSVEMLGETFKMVAPVAATAGASLEEMAAAAGLLGDAGIQATEAGTGLRSVMLRLAAPPIEAAKALERLGVSTKDAQGNFRGMGPVLADVDRAMKEMNLGTAEQLEIQEALYGKVAIASGAILQQAAASGTLAEKTKELENAQGSASAMAETMNDNLAGAFKRLMSAVEGFQIEMMTGANPAVRTVVELLAGAINTVTGLAKAFPLLTSAVVALTFAFVALVALAPFIAATISVLKSLAALKIGATIAGWAPVIVKTVLVIKGALFSLPALAVVAAVAVVAAFREPIQEFLGWLWNALPKGFRDALGWVGDGVKGVTDSVGNAVNNVRQGMADIANEAERASAEARTIAAAAELKAQKQKEAAERAAAAVKKQAEQERLLASEIRTTNAQYDNAIKAINAREVALQQINKIATEQNNLQIAQNNLGQVILQNKLALAKTDEDKLAIIKQIAALDQKAAQLQYQATMQQIQAERTLLQIKKDSANKEWEKASAAAEVAKNLLLQGRISQALANQAIEASRKAQAAAAAANRELRMFDQKANVQKQVTNVNLQRANVQAQGQVQLAEANMQAVNQAQPRYYIETPSGRIPQFAAGGFVTSPTIAEIAEGGEPEYVVPQSKAASFASNIMQGRTGAAALAPDPWGTERVRAFMAKLSKERGGRGLGAVESNMALRSLGFSINPWYGATFRGDRASIPDVRPRGTANSGSMAAPGASRTATSAGPTRGTEVKSLGPVEIKQNLRIDNVQRLNGQDMVSVEDVQRIAGTASQDAVNQIIRLLQQPTFRQQVGLR